MPTFVDEVVDVIPSAMHAHARPELPQEKHATQVTTPVVALDPVPYDRLHLTKAAQGAAGRRNMHISKLTLINYRNFKNTSLRFHKAVNTSSERMAPVSRTSCGQFAFCSTIRWCGLPTAWKSRPIADIQELLLRANSCLFVTEESFRNGMPERVCLRTRAVGTTTWPQFIP